MLGITHLVEVSYQTFLTSSQNIQQQKDAGQLKIAENYNAL